MHQSILCKGLLHAGALCVLCASACSHACAAPPGWEAADAATLDGLRGGFTSPDGLRLAVGIERMVSMPSTDSPCRFVANTRPL